MPLTPYKLAVLAGRFYTLGVTDCVDVYHPDVMPYFDLYLTSTLTEAEQQVLTDAYESGYFDTEETLTKED